MTEQARTTEPLIILIRGRRVVLDADLARLYGVTTGRFNEAFKRNRRRFPGEFAFQLSPAEFVDLKRRADACDSQPSDFNKENVNLSQIAIGSQKHRDPRLRPWAFTEHGALMAANILRSERAGPDERLRHPGVRPSARRWQPTARSSSGSPKSTLPCCSMIQLYATFTENSYHCCSRRPIRRSAGLAFIPSSRERLHQRTSRSACNARTARARARTLP